MQCPFHDDRRPSLSVNLDTGAWICFAGCGSGGINELAARVGKDDYGVGVPRYAKQEEAPILRSWKDRGFTSQMIAKWGIVWDEVAGAMRLPVYSNVGEVRWSIWRAPKGVEPPYQYEPGADKKSVLYGSWRLVRAARRVLVEGPLDAIWCQEAEVPGVAILGSVLSEEQMALLTSQGVRQAVLCFDNDQAGRRVTEQATGMLRRAGIWVFRVTLPEEVKDIQEVPLGRVAAIVDGAKLCVNGSGVIHPHQQHWLRPASKRKIRSWR